MEQKLNSLELHGYKTFARQTVLGFPAKITAIVGPNGSGKSNVADAIRWVLGEQSYTLLRAKKTEDMIYAGSDQRSRAGMASVSINFNNQDGWLPIDYNEVVLTRRAYRDGQNEYLINNQRVRLKDFHELLAKTGLSDRTYTIIGQGLVDLALSIRPDERRKLFEEAAGIGLFRNRKEEALKRLEATERNLERVSDILDEIRPRLRSLERQAQRVGEYKVVQETLQRNLRDWYGYHWYSSQKEIDATLAKIAAAQALTEDGQMAYNAFVLQAESKRQEIDEQRQNVNQIHQQLSSLHDGIQSKNQELAVKTEQKRATENSLAQLEQDIERAKATAEGEKSGIEDLKLERTRLGTELRDVDMKLSESEGSVATYKARQTEILKQRGAKQSELIELEKGRAVSQAKLANLLDSRARVERGLAEVKQSSREFERDSAARSKDLDKLNEQRKQVATEVEQAEQKRVALDKQREALREELNKVDGQVNNAQLELNRIQHQIDTLEQSKENLTGFSEGAKRLVESTKKGSTHYKLTDLASKLVVPEQFEKAIAAALGEAIDLLVVRDERMTLEMLNSLSSQTTERVAVTGEKEANGKKQSAVPTGAGIIGLASELVQTKNGFSETVLKLLQDHLVVEDLRTALRLHSDSNLFHYVTLNGEIIQRNGVALIGKGKAGSKIAYQRSVIDLTEALGQAESALAGLNKEKARIADQFEKTKSELREVEQSWVRLTESNSSLQRKVNAATFDADRNQEKKSVLDRRQVELEQQIEENRATELDIKKTLESIAASISATTAELELIRKSYEELTTENLDQKYQELVTEKKLIQQAIAQNKSGAERQTARHEQTLAQVNGLTSRQLEATEALTKLNTDLQALNGQLDQMKSEANSLHSERLGPETEVLGKLEAGLAELVEQEQQYQQKLNLEGKTLTQLQLDLARQQARLDGIKGRIEDDFGLIELEYKNQYAKESFLPFQDLVIETLPEAVELPEGLDEEIRVQKAQLRRIGTVNIDAENEYREVKDRADNLTTQTVDLKAAISDIQTLVKNLDEIMRRDFLATFTAVSGEFTQMFSRLFNGGSAKLVLLDEESPIEGGIEIQARLPGRREQGLVLLSGGERSLTAVALIFALLKISPTPICVLDEVDAMLDESNVGRFIELLKDLSTETQFLLITHNRNTVQAADVIYGVTMAKDTTSQVISLKLDEVDESFVK